MWDPAKYLDFDDHRARPFNELIARIDCAAPRRVVDLGCGPGKRTETLAARWPAATIVALDSSPEMVAAARERGFDAHVGDVREWRPAADTEVVVCNAVLQWVPGHASLVRRWAESLTPGAWFALQVPGNFGAPSHVLLRELVASARWRERLASITSRDERAVLDPVGYATVLADAGCAVDAWETTYVQRLSGANAVLEWMTGTALRPTRSTLDDAEWTEFVAALAPRLREAYPVRDDGTTWFPFRRVFAVARKV
jgi:trans-aconitate 2-methyltransferase